MSGMSLSPLQNIVQVYFTVCNISIILVSFVHFNNSSRELMETSSSVIDGED